MKAMHTGCLVPLVALVGAASVPPTVDAQSSIENRLHAQAVAMFRLGRFPEAYGRFIELAGAGHPASARYALWMCEHGPELFGKDWDCAPNEVEDWARAAAIVAPTIVPKRYPVAPGPRPLARDVLPATSAGAHVPQNVPSGRTR